MKNGMNTKIIGLIILVIALFSIAAFFVITLLNNGDNKEENNGGNNGGNNGNNNNPVVTDTNITSIYEMALTDAEQLFDVGGKEITIMVNASGDVVVNNNANGIKANAAYITNQVVIFGNKTKCGTVITGAIDKNGNSISVPSNDYKLIDFRMFEDKCVARNVGVCSCNDTYDYCDDSYDIVFTYNGNSILISNLY